MPEHDTAGESAHGAQDAALQEIVDRLTAEHAGSDPTAARATLERELQTAGLRVSSEKWLGDTAVEIAAGRRLVVDGRQGLRDDPDDDVGAGT